MVQFSSTVHFDQSEPLVFYYEQYQYNYQEPNDTLKKLKAEAKKAGKVNTEYLDQEILEELKFEGEDWESKVNYEEIGDKREDSAKKQYSREEDAKNNNTNCNNYDSNGGNNSSSVVNDVDAGVREKEGKSKLENMETKNSEDKISNATYFYRILHHLIDVTSDGTRFRCRKRSPEACDSCKIVERLIFTYFDTTTLEDIGAERVARGKCSHIYCQNQISKSGCKSKYKIDVISKNIYNREEYESFCSVKCLEENKKVHAKMATSPVETGSFTPRAMRCADNETLKKLHDNVFTLPECSSEGKMDIDCENIVKMEQVKVDMSEISGVDNVSEKKGRYDTFEIYEDFESFDSLSDSSMSEVNVKFDKETKNLRSIYKSAEGKGNNEDKISNKEKEEGGKVVGTRGYIEQDSLGMFSVLWYVLSNLITKRTRELINSGIPQQEHYNEQFEQLYDCCIRDLPTMMTSTLKQHVQHILSTFNPVKNDMLNNKILEPLSQVIIYALLVNRHHLPLNYSHHGAKEGSTECQTDEMEGGVEESSPEEAQRTKGTYHYDRYREEIGNVDCHVFKEKIEKTLGHKYKLDQDSIEILLELFIQL
ncbi:conserved hypothetical protein [Theileria orientalis strain Shintoku]|uniref:RTR1-type domain-containing protein n=1 Tax=Theileria orientalis strain Shintoku TaxID=869250 RepID=J4D6I9_THEOR|nr:conserved hypothetical protein [Theileria orientalis strain Shintoku]PVC49560.1 hypothetical protein MACL_00002914 [Theileria orientalis]BAM39600.1 conserved hypothetical protein [Theileria orientalis strain Shintoku]|eukprot:XP_009689901.1 conserved hypothetical protein [Theileria orientalis strain Shintoku]